MSDKWEERAKKLENVSKKMNSLGKTLTLVLTLPIILGLIFGPIGAGIGIVVAILYIVGSKGKKTE